MAREIIDMTLPSGEVVELDIDSSWSDEVIREKVLAAGIYGEATEGTTVPKNTPPQDAAPASEEDDMPAFDENAKPETAPKRDLTERFKRQQELGVRAVVEGAAGFPLMIGDAANTTLNFIPGVELGMPSQIVREALPLATPETEGERVAGMITMAGTGTAAGIKTAAKLTTGAVNRFMTEQAAMQLAVGTAAGAGMGVGAEADLGPVGTIVAGLMGGLAGGAGAKVGGKMISRWADSRVLVDKPITLAEVKEQAQLDGHTAADAELRNVQETLEELRTAQKADEQIKKMRPVASDPIEVKRAKVAMIRRMGGDKNGNLPIETQRELARIQRVEIARAEAKVRAVEEQKAQATPEMKRARALEGSTFTKVEGVEGKPGVMGTWGNAVISRIENVSPQLGMAVRRVTQRGATRTTDDIHAIDKFYKSPELKALSKAEARELDRAFLNGDADGANLIMAKSHGLQELYADNVSKLLADVQGQRTAGGLDGFIENFHPRVVVKLRALQKMHGKEVAGKIEQAIKDKRRMKRAANEGEVTENEIAALVNQSIGGRALKVLKDRRINEITPQQQKFYANSRDSMIDYLHNHHNSVATRDFFKHNLGQEVKLGSTIDEIGLGTILTREMKAGNLSIEQVDELAPLLSAQFGVSRQAVGGVQRKAKNVFTAGVLANPLSTITQFGDIAPLMQKFGVRQTLSSLFGKKALDVYDVGVRELSKDARTARGSARLVRDGLTAVGFDKLDKIMANTGVNAAFSKWTKLARKSPLTTQAKLKKAFGDADAAKITDDLANGRVTDDVKTFLLNEMGDIRPVGREDMPLLFQKHPNGRFMFSLLSWTIKQANFVRNSAMRDFKAGKKTKATTDFIKFLTLMGVTNGAAQSAKDWVRGKDIEPGSAFVSGALSIGMAGKFVVNALQRGEGERAMLSLVPFLGILAGAIEKGFNGVMKMEPFTILEGIPSFRNFKSILDGDLPAMLLAAAVAGPAAIANAVVGPAEAGTHGAMERPAQLGQREQAQVEAELREVRGQTQLPEGTLELKPSMTGDDIDQARAQMDTVREIEQERTAEIEQPKSATDAEYTVKTRESIQRHEGKGKVESGPGVAYDDSKKLRTIGYGILMEKKPKEGEPRTNKWIPEVKKEIEAFGLNAQDVWDGKVALDDEQMDKMFDKHYAKAEKQAKGVVSNYKELPKEAQSILTEMVFQIGLKGVVKFKEMRKGLRNKDYLTAYHEMLDSKWARSDSPERAKELALRMLDLEV